MQKIVVNVITVIGIASSVSPWLIPKLDFKQKIIVTLSCILIYLISYIFFITRENSKLRFRLKEIGANHRALSAQFAEKQQIIRGYENASSSINMIMAVAISHTKEAKLQQISEAIFIQLEQAKTGGIKDGKTNKSN